MALSLKVSAQHHVFMVTSSQEVLETDFYMFVSDEKIAFDNGDEGLWTYDVIRFQNVWLDPNGKIILSFYQLDESVMVFVHKEKGKMLALYQVFEQGVTYQFHSLDFKNSISEQVERIVSAHSLELMEEKI